MVKPLTKNEFIKKAILVHGNKYDYSKVKYKNRTTKIEIYCKNCKIYFWQTPNGHLRGCGCKRCGYIKHSLNSTITKEEFLERAKQLHGDKYEYFELKDLTSKKKIKIYCKKCKLYFYQLVAGHLRGCGCTKCGNLNKGKTKLLSLKDFIEKANEIHKDRYDYTESEYKNCRTNLKIKCKKCNNYFFQTPSNHLSGKGCPYCMQSKGELYIQDWLNKKGISFIIQKRFKECKDQNILPFDFYLPDYNLCIEFQGQQHYDPKLFIDRYKSKEKGLYAYKKQKYHDTLKEIFCKNRKIRLLKIKYNDNINVKLKGALYENYI